MPRHTIACTAALANAAGTVIIHAGIQQFHITTLHKHFYSALKNPATRKNVKQNLNMLTIASMEKSESTKNCQKLVVTATTQQMLVIYTANLVRN